MKKLLMKITLVCAVCLAAHSMQAQTVSAFRSMPAEKKAQLITDSLKVILNLTNDQYSKAYPIILVGITKAAPVVKSSDSRIAKGQKLRALLAETEAKMKQVLTPDQFSAYQDNKQRAIAYYRVHMQNDKQQ